MYRKEHRMTDEYYMNKAIRLAKKGEGFVSPNPMVGAVVVKRGVVIGKGYHQRYGDLHAERNALKNCSEDPKGATLYVTLEPCCHHGKTPPCTDIIIEKGISRVVVGTMDVNPLVAGKGIEILRNHGIQVDVGILENECIAINKFFNKHMTTGLPYVVMKYAMTADGKIATKTGGSKWITSDGARESVHKLRKVLSAIMVGVSTVIADDPMLNCRLSEPHIDPVRIVCDTHLRTPLSSQLVRTANEIKTIIATSVDPAKAKDYERHGCQILQVPKKGEHLDLTALFKKLGSIGINSILLEGGGTLNFSALSEHLVDEVYVYMAPKIFGGSAKSPVEGIGIDNPGDAIKLNTRKVTGIGPDILIQSEVEYLCSPE